MSYDLIKVSIKSSIKNIKVINYFNYFKSSLTKTKNIEEIKIRYRKEPKIYQFIKIMSFKIVSTVINYCSKIDNAEINEITKIKNTKEKLIQEKK